MLTEDTNLKVVGLPGTVLTERQPSIAPSEQVKKAKKYLRLWRKSHDLTFNFDVITQITHTPPHPHFPHTHTHTLRVHT